ncbi:MAG: GntR family transcriptional regulator [Limibaculum sp.]
MRTRLTVGEWTPGAVLPGDSMLAAEMRVSPGTVRRAVEWCRSRFLSDDLAYAVTLG